MPEAEKVKAEEKKEEAYNCFIDKTQDEYISWVEDQVLGHPVVKQQHGIWKELISWEEGNQYSKWDGKTRTVVPAELRKRKKLVVINLLKPLNETIEGKLNFYHHVIGVPNSGEEKDIKGAAVATKLLDYNDYVNKMEDLMEEMKYDLLRPAIACKKWVWDKNARGFILRKKDDGNKKNVEEPGEVVGEVVQIFNIRQDPTAKKREGMRWIVELKILTEEDILATFPEVKKDELKALAEGKDSLQGTNEPVAEKGEEQTYVVKEFWQRPTTTYPKGRYIVSYKSLIFHAGENPSPDYELPYFFYYYKKSPYSFWPKGPLHYAQPIQRELNRTTSIISEEVEAWRPKILVPRGALLRANSMTKDAFEVLEVNYGRGEPKAVQMPELSQQVLAWRDFLISAIDKVSNIHEVSYARLPQYASRAPASLYSMMLETESEKLHPMVKRINKTLVEQAKFRLKLMAKHYKRSRLVKIIGTNRQSLVEYFSKDDLNENTDVRLEIGVSLNQSATIQQRLIMELWDKGIFTEKDRVRIKRMFNFGTAENELRSEFADAERVLRENQAFMDNKHKDLTVFDIPDRIQEIFKTAGVDISESAVYMHDDHELHIEEHTNLIKSPEAERWEKDQRAALSDHINVHFTWLNIERASAQGAAPAPRPASQPGGEVTGGGRPGPSPAEMGPSMGESIEGGPPPIR